MLCKASIQKRNFRKKGDRILKPEYVLPNEIEKRSFEIIESELGGRAIPEEIKPIVMRVIHTTADFDYYDNLCFSDNAVETALEAIKNGAVFVTDTNMAKSGIKKAALKKLGCEAVCFMSDEDVAEAARKNNTTRATAAVDKAAKIGKPVIFAAGNAPTALIRLNELIGKGVFSPKLVIGPKEDFPPQSASRLTYSSAFTMPSSIPKRKRSPKPMSTIRPLNLRPSVLPSCSTTCTRP